MIKVEIIIISEMPCFMFFYGGKTFLKNIYDFA